MAFSPNPAKVRSLADVLANANAALFAGYDEARRSGNAAASATMHDAWKGYKSLFTGKGIVDVFKGVAEILEGSAPKTRDAWRKLAAEYYYNVELRQKPTSTALMKGQTFQAPEASTPWWVWPAVGLGGVVIVGSLLWTLGGKSSDQGDSHV